MEQFSADLIDNFQFWDNFWDMAEFPSNNDRDTTALLLNDDIKGEYFFVDLANRYRLTEKGIGLGNMQQTRRYNATISIWSSLYGAN